MLPNRFNRRDLLKGSVALALMPRSAKAWPFHGKQQIGHGWNTLPVGAGGQIDNIHIANDGSMVCRGDVFGAFKWSGTSAMASITDPNQKWSQVCTLAAFGITNPGGFESNPFEYVQAPGNSNYHYLLTGSSHSPPYGVYTSSNKGDNWTAPNVFVPYPSAGLQESYKVAVDPNNEKIAYWTLASNGGLSAGVYTTFDRTNANTWPNFNAATLDGTTAFPNCSVATGGGIAFDTSLGTITINGQLVTRRAILCVGGSGIYETTDGGQNWTEIAVSHFGSAAFHVVNAFFDGDTNANSVHNYFCSTPELSNKIWRYVGGGPAGWTDITRAGGFSGSVFLIVDPRVANVGYLTVYGANGIGTGYTTTNATAATPTWGGATGGQVTNLRAASYDLPWVNHIFGQSVFTNGVLAVIDQNGTCFWCGNQSIFYFSAIPNYAISNTTTSNSFGRGQEGTVACDVLRAPGGSLPVIANQDLGAPMLGNSFVSYPTDMVQEGKEYLASSLEWAANDTSFYVARMTGQVGSTADVSSYSTDYGKTWTTIAGVPTALWQSVVTGTVSAGVFTATSFVSGNIIFPNTLVYIGGTYYGIIASYGTGGTTGTGGAGGTTYSISGGASSGSGNFTMSFQNNSGQTVAVDHDHWVTIPTGQDGQYSIPVYTTNATTTASWAFCQQGGGGNMPADRWSCSNSWQGGDSPKVMAVGYGVDQGTVWIGQLDTVGNTVTLWRSNDVSLWGSSGCIFSIIASASCNTTHGKIFVLSVPGYPNELWFGVSATGGSGNVLWHVTNANTASATMTPMTGTNLPTTNTLLHALTLGAPSSPGGYPLMYATFEAGALGTVPPYLYQGVWNGTTLTWSLYGPAGADQGANTQLPKSFGLNGIGNVRGDWVTPGLIYVTNNGMGCAYYNP